MLDDVLMHRVEASDVVEIGVFEIEFIHASHSLVDCFSLAIHTPVGTIIHTGDYKIDDTPVIGEPYDLKTLKRIGDEGVLRCFAIRRTRQFRANAVRAGRNSRLRRNI